MLRKSCIGETNINNEGYSMTIIEYYHYFNIDVEFEDKQIVRHTAYNIFKEGILEHPKVDSNEINRIGETVTINENKQMKIVEYNNNQDITVEFNNGQRVNTTYDRFKNGLVIAKNNKIQGEVKHKISTDVVNRLGSSTKNKSGHTMTIVGYRNSRDIDILFENGRLVEHTNYNYFINGSIAFKSRRDKLVDRLGKVIKHRSGLNTQVIEYRGSADIDIQFEDGTIIEHRTYRSFEKGYVAHPKFKRVEEAYQFNNKKYFECKCRVCKGVHILSLDEMKDFECREI